MRCRLPATSFQSRSSLDPGHSTNIFEKKEREARKAAEAATAN
jgi:hypothetical protein